MQHSLTSVELDLVREDLQKIKEKKYDIGDVSDLMKRLVNEVYGDDDWSTSGFWVRAEDFFKKL